jgi:hypothetical protein
VLRQNQGDQRVRRVRPRRRVPLPRLVHVLLALLVAVFTAAPALAAPGDPKSGPETLWEAFPLDPDPDRSTPAAPRATPTATPGRTKRPVLSPPTTLATPGEEVTPDSGGALDLLAVGGALALLALGGLAFAVVRLRGAGAGREETPRWLPLRPWTSQLPAAEGVIERRSTARTRGHVSAAERMHNLDWSFRRVKRFLWTRDTIIGSGTAVLAVLTGFAIGYWIG